jgi:biopolymer transport protein ExbD
MAIERPGKRPREGTKHSPLGRTPRRRPSAVSLSMTSMIDCFVVLTVFLLITFDASPQCHASSRPLPVATNGFDIVDAPIIDVRPAGTFLDGTKVSSNDELVRLLKTRHDVWKQLHPGKDLPRDVLLAIDPDVPSGIVKGVVKAAADGGYPSIDFMVNRG